MGTVRSCPQCGNRKCVPNREKLVSREAQESDGLPAPLLQKKLHDAAAITDQAALDLIEGHLDISSPKSLLRVFDMLTQQAVVVQACTISASTAMAAVNMSTQAPAPLPYGSPPSYKVIRQESLERLGKIGNIFVALGPCFQELAFGSSSSSRAWASRPVDVGTAIAKRTGRAYLNTFKDDGIKEPAARREAFSDRLNRFFNEGGKIEDIIELHPVQVDEMSSREDSLSIPGPNMELLTSLVPGAWYDYVVTVDNVIRLYPSSAAARRSRPKCGHTLLACPVPRERGASAFSDDPVIMAGDLCALRSPSAQAQVLVVTNNSSYFKPNASDLQNVLPAFEKVGIRKNSICLYNGPNSIVALRKDLLAVQDVDAVDPGDGMMLNPYAIVSQWEKQR